MTSSSRDEDGSGSDAEGWVDGPDSDCAEKEYADPSGGPLSTFPSRIGQTPMPAAFQTSQPPNLDAGGTVRWYDTVRWRRRMC